MIHDNAYVKQPEPDEQPQNTSTPILPRRLSKVLSNLKENLEKRQQQRALAEDSSAPNTDKDSDTITNHTQTGRSLIRGKTSENVILSAQMELFELEREGRFTSLPITPQSEFPTFLTRLPIFIPGRRSTQREMLDDENALAFSTPWGNGRKHGPPLTVYDEDTLIGIGRLRQKLLIGKPSQLPMTVSEVYRHQHDQDVRVHALYCMLTDIQSICETSRGGQNNKLRLNSLKRLAATSIEFDANTFDKYTGTGSTVKLIDVAWRHYYDNAVLYIQFTPVMADWYEKAYTYINWTIRRQLTDTGKAVHRFLSGQPKHYEIHVKKLMMTLGYPREYRRFTGDLRTACQQLRECGWLLEWKIEGNGRTLPHKLIIYRKD